MILGLDVSTSITGATLLDDSGSVVLNEAWDTRKYKNFFEKVKYVEEKIKTLSCREEKIEKVYIEQSLQSFRSGFSSAKTLSTLARFNGVVSWLVYRILQIEPEYLAATSARKLCGIRVPKGQKAKQVVLEHLINNEPVFIVEYTKHGNPRPESYDKADSLIIARAGYNLCQSK